jgi:hypothetical protein
MQNLKDAVAKLLEQAQSPVEAKDIAGSLIETFSDLIDVGAELIDLTGQGSQLADNIAEQHDVGAGSTNNPHTFDLAEDAEAQKSRKVIAATFGFLLQKLAFGLSDA